MPPIRGQTGASQFIAGLMAPRPMNPRHAWEIIEPYRCALQRVLEAVPNEEDIGLVGIALNQAWLRLRRLGGRSADMQELECAVRALERQSVRQAEPPADDDAEALKVAIAIYDRTLRASTLRDWAEVEDELLRNAHRGQLV